MRTHIFIIAFCCLGVVVSVSDTLAQRSKVGDFDIRKVQEAVETDMEDSVTQEIYPADQSGRTQPLTDNYLMITLRIIGYLVLLTLIIILVIWGMKRLGLTGTSRIGGGSMDLLEALPIGQNRSLILVRVMDAVYVLAQTAQNITLLEKIEGDKAVELIASTKGGTSIVQFKDVFNNFIGKIKKSS